MKSNGLSKYLSFLSVLSLFASGAFAQLTGIKNIPGDYATVTAAVSALNAAGPGTGGVTFNVAANYTETITATISLTATGTAVNPIIFQKAPAGIGPNPVITAYTGGSGTPATTLQDGIWRLTGSDYITIDGIDVKDNPANTTNPSTMEYGYALYKASTANGCQNVTIKNCVITLNKINNMTGSGPMADGSTGIIVINSLATSAITTLTPIAGGTNSNNKFYGNLIQNCNTGIALIGFAAPTPFTLADTNNDVGGSAVSTGNTIVNYGGGSGATNPAVAIRTLAQYGLNVSYNTINNNNGAGANHPVILRGIFINSAASASATIANNTVTVKGAGSTHLVSAIENASGSTAAGNTITISNNLVTNCTYSTATSGALYGINNSASPATITITNNVVSNNSSSATTGTFYGIYNSGAAIVASVTNNTFSGNSIGATMTGLFSGIYNSAAVKNLTISNNTFAGNLSASLTGAYYPVYNYGAATTSINIDANNIGNAGSGAITFSAANSNPQIFIYNRSGGSGAALSISNNNFQGINYSVTGTGANTFIANSAATLSQVISNNKFTNLNVNTKGSITFISNNVIVAATGTQNVNSNTIIGTFTKSGVGGTVTLFTSVASSAAGSVINNNLNNFSNLSVTGATAVAGWVNTDAGASTKAIQNNTFSNWTGGTSAVTVMSVNVKGANNATTGNLINNISGSGAITGIATATGNDNIFSNSINALSTIGAAAVNGILINAGTNKNIYNNRIYDLQATIAGGTVNGILVSGTTVAAANIYNNLVGDLRTPAGNVADPVRGISVTATAANSTINVYNNSIYLNAGSTGTNFGTTGIYHTSSITATSALLNLRNNIITNFSVANGTGLTVAYRRSSSVLTNYASTSNNNLFYAGTPAANRLIFFDGTNADQTLTSYKARVAARETQSVTEDLVTASKFLSTIGSSPSFLHLDPTKANLAEGGAANITGYVSDVDAQVRQGNAGYTGTGSAPDIGADEFDGLSSPALSGSYSVGAGQTFTSLTNAGGLFAGINSVGLSGNVVVKITSDLLEDGSNILNLWAEKGTGNYSLTIQPNASTLRTISGNVLNGLIRFNGANRVIIDGSNGTAGKYLTFRNTNTVGTSGAAFTFINGGSNNIIKYCTIEAYTGSTSGVILFSTSLIAGGNSNNTINNCNINATVSSNTGNLCIYSAGTTGKENYANIISNNNIFNYRDRAIEVTATGSSAWTISGNSLYNGDVAGLINYAPASTLHGIKILGGSGYTIINNYIGGNTTLASGTTAAYSSTSGNAAFQGILLTTTNPLPASNIKGNTIANIAVSSVPTAANSNAFIGIETNGAGINIGGNIAGEGNTIGSNTMNGSVTVTTTTATAISSIIRGINCLSAGGVVIGNQVGGIDIKNIGTVPGASSFVGIYVNNATAASPVNSNIIGSNGAGAAINSIRVLAASTSTLTSITGILIAGSVNSAILLNGNIIQNISYQNSNIGGNLTGISNAAAALAAVTITNNIVSGNTTTATTGGLFGIYSNSPASITIGNNTISGNSCTATTGGFLYGSYTQGVSPTVTLNTNTFSGNTMPASTTGVFTGIYNAANAVSLSISSNTFSGNATASLSGIFYPIYNAGAVTGTININSNNIGTSASGAITYTAANSGASIFINNIGGTASAALSVSNNIFQGNTYAVNGTGNLTYISNAAATLSQVIDGNIFTNLNVNTSGNLVFISDNVIVPATGFQNVINNSISGTFTKAAGSTLTLFTSGVNSANGSTINHSDNNFSNIAVSGATVIAGWINTDAGTSTKTITNNTFGNWTGGNGAITALSVNISGTGNATSGNIINNISGGAAVTGITSASGNDNIFSNTINTLVSSGAALVTGISITAGANKNIYKNKIYDLSNSNTAGTVNGILVSGGTTVNVYNNMIGDLRTPVASAADPVRGISVSSTVASSSINIYYNTIYLNASSTGAVFGSTGIYHTSSGTATTATLNLRNNSITNVSTPAGTGLTVAYRRSAATLANYAPASNNNLFYAGSPSTGRLIFHDGTSGDQTLAAFKSRLSTIETNAVTGDLSTKYLSTTGSSPQFLHLNTAIPSSIEGGAVNIAGFTDDFDGQVRAGNPGYIGALTTPDIGADEIFGIETVSPAINYILLTNTILNSTRNVTGINITDASGINTAAGTKPRIYYKRSSDANSWIDNTPVTNGWKFAEASNLASPFSFTIDYSLLNGGSTITAGVIQYFIVAQDLSAVANVAINSGTFAATPSSVALTSTAFPVGATINSYNIPFAGNYNVGAAEVFTSLTRANGLFATINSVGLIGNTTFNITSDLAEDGTNALNQWTETGVGNYTVTIQPDAATPRNISGNAAAGLIRLNGADRVMINGNNGGAGSYLGFKNTNTAGTTGTAFTLINGASNNTIQYCDVKAYADASNGVILFGTCAVAGGNSNNVIDNCTINATVLSNTGIAAIYSYGTAGNENSFNTISNNSIYGYRDRGLEISSPGSTAWTISGNSFYNGSVSGAINYPASSTLHGIRILGGSGYNILNNYIGGNTSLASGANAVYASNLGNLSYQGILLNTTGPFTPSYIKGNTIAAISVNAVPTAANSIAFTGIETGGSAIDIGGNASGEGNIIGSAAASGSITLTTSTIATGNSSLIKGINCNSSGGAIIGNQVAGIDINNIGTAPASSSFTGINVNNTSAPSQVLNNIIGSRETVNSIRVLPSSSATTTAIAGITIAPAVISDMLLSGNMIENISHLSATSSGNFIGINNNASSGTYTISNDTIQNISAAANANSGSSFYTAISSGAASVISNNIINNITQASTGTNAQVTGIYVSGAFVHSISFNIISNLTTASAMVNASVETGSPAQSAVTGILNTATAAGQLITDNTLYNFAATNVAAVNTSITGIGITGNITGNIFNNRVAGFTNKSTGIAPGICGVVAYNGSFNLYNNSIKLDNATNVNGVKIYGIIHTSANNWNYYHNSISIGGNSTGTSQRSAAFIRSVNGSLSLRNNVFVNSRTGTGFNGAISNIAAIPASNWPASASNYNDLFSSNVNAVGEWGISAGKTFSQWQTASGGEANSVSRPSGFITSLYDLQPDNVSNCALSNSGTPITTPFLINTDISNASRNSISPAMGAYEFTYTPFFIIGDNNSPVCSGSLVSLSADPGSALNATYSWTDPGNIIVSTAQNPDLIAQAGTYTLTVTDATGCFNTTTTAITLMSRPTGNLSGPAFVCSGSAATLSMAVTGTGTISGFLSNGDIFTGTAPLITASVLPSSTTSFIITSLTDDNCAAQLIDLPNTIIVKVTQDGEWTGASGTSWNDAGNWCGGIPVNTTDIIIPSGVTNYPLVNGAYDVRNINVSAGAILTTTASGTLKVSGIYNNAGILANNGKIILNGSSLQNFPGSSATVTAMNSLEVNNTSGVSIDQSFNLAGTLTSTAGIIDLADKIITLHSDAATTANVAAVTGGFAYSGGGKFMVERYIPARRAWRLMTTPLTGTNTIFNSWQNAGVYTPGMGTLVSGPGGGNGLDAASSSSLKQYDVASHSLVAVGNTNISISSGNSGSADNTGYFIFIRGDRNPSNFNAANKNSTTLSSMGKLQTGPQIFTAGSAAGSYTLIGNPYASPVDFSNTTRANLAKRFYVWDPLINQVGGYVLIDDFDNDGIFSTSPSNSKQRKEIQSQQAFFVQTVAPGPAWLTINESDKSGINNNLVFRPAATTESLSMELYLLNADNTTVLADGVLAEYNDNYSDSVKIEDAVKFGNVNEELALLRHGTALTLERRPIIRSTDTLYIKITKITQRPYQFSFNAVNFNHPGLIGILKDKYLGSETIINSNGLTTINFSVTSDVASSAFNRFMIVFQLVAAPLPVTFTSLRTYQKNQSVAVDWDVENEINIAKYEVEKSVDGRRFNKVNTTMAKGNSNIAVHYNWLDDNPAPGNNFYRIGSIDLNGQTKYSEIEKIVFGETKSEISVYPNPLQNNTINLQFNNEPAGSYQVSLINNAGQLIFTSEINISNSNTARAFAVPQLLTKGIYQLEVKGLGKLRLAEQVMVQ